MALITKIVDHVSSMENTYMIQRTNSPTRRLVAPRRVALLASVAGVGFAVLAGGPDLYTADLYSASNASTWISSAAAAEIHGWMGVRIQAVLPGATATDLWEKAGLHVNWNSRVHSSAPSGAYFRAKASPTLPNLHCPGKKPFPTK